MIQNPPIDRLKYIAKTYAKQPWIVLDMVEIIARTVGEDRWSEEVMKAAQAVDSDLAEHLMAISLGQFNALRLECFFQLVDGRPMTTPDTVDAVVAMVGELPGFKTAHAADGAFPWMAIQLSKLAKPVLRAVPLVPEDDRLNVKSPVGGVLSIGGARTLEAGHLARELVVYNSAFDYFRRSGTAIGQWIRAKRPDLTKADVDLVKDEVRRFSEEWEEKNKFERAKGPVMYQWDDGWTIQKLTTKEQLDHEGHVMQHCVGSYCDQVEEGTSVIYSLRDPKGRSHVTIEVDPKHKHVEQIKGKQNDKPKPEYQERVDEFLKEHDIGDKIPKHLREIVDVFEAMNQDVDDEYIVSYAQEWYDDVDSDAAVVEAWLKAGFWYTDKDLVSNLVNKDVTPDEVVKFPYIVLRYFGNHQPGYKEVGRLVELSRFAIALMELRRKYPDVVAPESKQLRFGHVDTGAKREARGFRHGPASEEDFVAWAKTNGGFSEWDVRESTVISQLGSSTAPTSDPADEVELFLPEAEDWINAGFTDPDDIEEWYALGLSPEEAWEWSESSASPEFLMKLRDAGVDYDEYRDVIRRHRQLDPALLQTRRGGAHTDAEIEAIIRQAHRDREEDERLRRINNNRRRRSR